ncbi:niemann-Pick type C-related protein 1 [Rhodotorula kratochvilovae]
MLRPALALALIGAHDQDLVYRSTLAQVCGDDFPTTTCCTLGQLETLEASLAQAEPLLASCPACRNNFRRFYCAFTCSPDQSLFLAVTATQTLSKDGEQREGVKRVEFSVADEFGDGFFDSCKGVKFGATNGFAMDLIGGGATDWLSFLRYMGQERALGSPFEIAFPSPSSPPNASFPAPTPLSLPALSCASADPSARCACPDCPAVCATLPAVRTPSERRAARCRIGRMDCFPFALCILYAAGLCAALGAYAVREAKRRWGSERARGAIYLGAEGDAEDEEGYDVPPRSAAAAAEDARRNTWARLRHRLSAVGWARPSRLEAGEADVAPLSEESVRSGSGVIGSVGGLVGAGSIASELEGGRARSGSGSTPSAGASRRSLQLSGASSSSAPGAALSLRDPPLDRAHTPDGGDGSALQPRSYALNTYLARAFHALGLSCARRPALTLALGLAACAVAHLGWARFAVEREPVALWVPKGSAVAREKARFDEAFGPFYRTEQLFFARVEGGGDAPVFDWDTLEWLVRVEDDIRALRSADGAITLADVCFAPTSESGTASSAEECVVQSPLGYFSNSLASLSPDTWAGALDACASSPAACLPPFGQPLNPALVLSRAGGAGAPAHTARAAIVTYVVRNSLDAGDVSRAEAWEASLGAYLRALSAPGGAAAQRGVKVSWSVGTSLEAELNAATNTDVPVVVLSYLVMFLYVAVALGGSASALARAAVRAAGIVGAAGRRGARWVARRARGGAVKLTTGEGEHFAARSGADSAGKLGASVRKRLFVDSKFLLGLWGIVIVLLSVSTSVALCSAAGVKVTLIIAEVIPFLVLAIGVDNVFLLSHELDRQNTRSYRHSDGALLLPGDDDSASSDLFLSVEERIARTLARVGPSILLSASCETVAFALGALVGMPAVRNFAIYAAGAVVVNALLQVTVFISLMTLDLHRVEANRVDCFPCFKLPVSPPLDTAPPSSESVLARFVRTMYAPNLVRKPVKFLVLALFSGLFVLSWIGARHIDLGLDQRLALPSSSYLVDYFNSVDAYLDVGPPVYFVAEGRNVTALANVQRFCSRFSACEDLSLANVLEAERKRPESSYLAEPPAVWIDDFISWTNPILEDCCRVKRRDSSQFCGPNDPEGACKPCFEDREPPWSTTLEGFPQGEEFMRYLEQWLSSPTDESCPLGGKAGYSSALALSEDGDGVELSHFRTYHTPLKTQDDFINAFAAARRIADDLSRRTGARVFPYSLFYVFFASYGELWATAREVLAFALGAVFLVTSLLLGSFRTGSVVAFTVFLSLVSVLGSMGAWGVSLNPLSLVNLVISIGIAVEFCAHLARAFMGALGGGVPFHHPAAKRDRDERAVAALEDVGASVVSGIGATKLIGIAVLGLTKSALLKTYYFKMWLALIVSSALHGLVLLPVLLSLFGGQGYALTTQDSDGGWIESSVQRRYERESRPFIDDDANSVDSGEY